MNNFRNDPRMCRPDDRATERQVAVMLAKNFKLGFVMAPDGAAYDFALDRAGKLVAVVEVKRRKMWWGQYPTIHLSVEKIRRCLNTAARFAVKFVFAVQCDDGLYIGEITPEMFRKLPRKMGGRSDRAHLNISTDQEELLDIPLDEFQKVV